MKLGISDQEKNRQILELRDPYREIINYGLAASVRTFKMEGEVFLSASTKANIYFFPKIWEFLVYEYTLNSRDKIPFYCWIYLCNKMPFKK